MTFELEKMGPDEMAKVMADASEQQLRRLTLNKYFERYPDLHWAIDRELGNYLLRGPKIDIRAPSTTFYFFFENRLVELDVPGFSGRPIAVREVNMINDFALFKKRFAAAIEVHGLSGMREREPALPLNFNEEV